MMNRSSEPELGRRGWQPEWGRRQSQESVLPSRLTVGAGVGVAVGAAVEGAMTVVNGDNKALKAGGIGEHQLVDPGNLHLHINGVCFLCLHCKKSSH